MKFNIMGHPSECTISEFETWSKISLKVTVDLFIFLVIAILIISFGYWVLI